jgi:hypothetical protein
MSTDAKKPKSLRWFEPSWSFRPRLKQDLACVLVLWTWVRVFVVALLLVILLASFVTRTVPNLQFDWTYAFIVAFGGIVLSIAAFIAFFWFVPPKVGINAKGVCRQQGNHAIWCRHSDIRCIILNRTLLERPRLCVEAAEKKEFDCDIASKIGLDSLAAFHETAFGKKLHKEAICAKDFWQILGRCLNDEKFVRDRLRGGLNNLLNYGYAVLLSTVLQKLFGVGLDPTFGISYVARERSTPLAYDLMEPFRPCVDWRVIQWAREHPEIKDWEITKEFRRWVTGFPLERVDYLQLTLEIQGVIEGVVRGFRRAVIENQPRYYKPWTPKNSKWAG